MTMPRREDRGKPKSDAARRIHASKDGCNGRPHTKWFLGDNKCDRLAALALGSAPQPECRKYLGEDDDDFMHSHAIYCRKPKGHNDGMHDR